MGCPVGELWNLCLVSGRALKGKLVTEFAFEHGWSAFVIKLKAYVVVSAFW
jgi:hypothetical protein